HHVLAERSRRRQHVAVAGRELDHQIGDVLGERMLIGLVVGEQHLGDAGDLGGSVGGRLCAGSCDQHMELAADCRGGGDGVERRSLERLVVVLGDDEKSHQITRASFLSLSTSSCAEPTFLPPWRFAGSSTLSVLRRGATSTLSTSGVTCSIGFFFAFMMLGSDA